MKTDTSERLRRIIFGLGLIAIGSFSNIYVTALAYLMGLILVGIGIYTKATEYAEDEVGSEIGARLAKPKEPSEPMETMKIATAPKAAKKTVRKKKISKK